MMSYRKRKSESTLILAWIILEIPKTIISHSSGFNAVLDRKRVVQWRKLISISISS